MKKQLTFLFAALLATLFAGFGCDIDSGDDVVRETGGSSVSGIYKHRLSTNGVASIITPPNTGNAITSLNIIQTGDRLEAIANDGLIYRGTIGRFIGNNASFSISGNTSAGNAATLSGTIRVEGTTGTLTGTWVEASLFGTASASASVAGAPAATPTPVPTTIP